ncbi:MAG: pentapeptide repeat-containing protein [Alphaproteobacteria bacterium]|nr:pentapeptide repeat-containing protein [Alphaproteobacteria bacterium]MBU0805217.1 pentapeptide repeat-containing protein [Alphaproteobacteria bacterium]MBU0870716.1 pentapeptide repeat-containing protein [Alphaproteobacteria bacterium]MBU1401609.1 pentapeptide repeat-containing protein [Alphaproteobacteria bacterium]MBU1591974.1 pentapeptide repeat-containing protein [Alphaproteobacteria bacterium]
MFEAVRKLRPALRGFGLLAAICALQVGLPASASAAEVNCRTEASPGIDWTDCEKKLIILRGADLNGAILTDVDFTSTDLRDTNLLAASLEKATLVRASLAGAKAKGAKFDRIEGYRTDFSGIDAQGAVFASAEIQRSNFTGANLTNADFTKAELGRADFADADITGSRFVLANLARADFSKSKFTGAIDFTDAFFFLTRIDGLDLSQSTGLAQWQVNMSCGNADTKLPEGLTPGADWPCNFD